MTNPSPNTAMFSVDTRERISKIAQERKRMTKTKSDRKTDRKTAVFASIDSLDGQDDEEFVLPGPSPSSERSGQNRSKDSYSTATTRPEGISSMSEHTGQKYRERHHHLDSPKKSDTSSSAYSSDDFTLMKNNREPKRHGSSTSHDTGTRSTTIHPPGWKSPLSGSIHDQNDMMRYFDSSSRRENPIVIKSTSSGGSDGSGAKVNRAELPTRRLSTARERSQQPIRREQSTTKPQDSPTRRAGGAPSSPKDSPTKRKELRGVGSEQPSSPRRREPSRGASSRKVTTSPRRQLSREEPTSPRRETSPRRTSTHGESPRRTSPPRRKVSREGPGESSPRALPRQTTSTRKERSTRSKEAAPSSTRTKERTGRSASPHAMSKQRTPSAGPLKRERSVRQPRAASLGPLKKERSKRSNSIAPLKRMPSPPKRVASPPTATKRTVSTTDARTLEDKLGGVPSSPTRKKGGASVASAPAAMAAGKKDNFRRTRRPSRESVEPRRTGSTRNAKAMSMTFEHDSPRKDKTAAPAKEESIANIGEFLLNDTTPTEKKKSPGRFSQRLSKGLRSFSKLAGFGGSGRNIFLNMDDESDEPSTKTNEKEKQRQPSTRKARDSVRVKGPATRSSSAGPLGNRPGLKRTTDRRAGMTKSRPDDPTNDDDDDEGENEAPRARSMMLHRETTRRGKSTSLMDIKEYKDEEIHSTSYFASNHVLVNRERMKRGLRPLTRNIAMDELARGVAQKMSDSSGKESLPVTYVGNVLRGESIRAIHRAVMQNKEGRERQNLLSPYFQDFGVGTSKGKDGMLYICQLFSERIELTITDTT